MSLFQKNENYLGVDIGAHGIKLVELHKTKGRPQLWTYGILDNDLDIHVATHRDKDIADLRHERDMRYENPKDIEAKKQPSSLKELVLQDARIDEYAGYLRMLAKEARVTSHRVTSSLPVSQVFHAILNLPHVEEKNIASIVNAEIAKVVPHDIADMQVVYQPVGDVHDKKKQYMTLLVTAAPKALVAFYTAIFQKAGLQLEELETEAFALARSLVGRDSTVSMVVDIGAERSNFFIIDNGLPMTHRSMQIGGNTIDTVIARVMGVDQAIVGQVKRDMSKGNMTIPTELFHDIIDPMAKEIQYSFDLYLRQTGNEGKQPEKIILTGGSGLFRPIQDYITSQFPLRVFIGDPWARVIYQDDLKQVLDELGPRMAVSIGLGLRNF